MDLTPRLAEAFSQRQAHVEAEALMRGAEVSPLIFSPGSGAPLNVQQVALRFRRLLTRHIDRLAAARLAVEPKIPPTPTRLASRRGGTDLAPFRRVSKYPARK